MFDIRPIKTPADHEAALAEIERLWGAREGTRDSARLEVIATLVGRFEDQHWPIEPPDPVEAIRFYIDQGRLTQSDLARILGSRARASEILSRRRHLTIEMIWNLHTAIGIPPESLVRPYSLSPALATGRAPVEPVKSRRPKRARTA
jgi:HTH-type transcriptional regulator/antitoxin HigA